MKVYEPASKTITDACNQKYHDQDKTIQDDKLGEPDDKV